MIGERNLYDTTSVSSGVPYHGSACNKIFFASLGDEPITDQPP